MKSSRYTEHFWGLLQFWRRTERDRLDLIGSAARASHRRNVPTPRLLRLLEDGEESL